jgi:hypothetical protein
VPHRQPQRVPDPEPQRQLQPDRQPPPQREARSVSFCKTVHAPPSLPFPKASVGQSSSTLRAFLRGDSHGDARIDLSDAVATLGYLFLGSAAPPCLDAADADDSGAVELSDPIFLLGALFLGQNAIPAPHPDCGQDTTADRLECRRGCAGPGR